MHLKGLLTLSLTVILVVTPTCTAHKGLFVMAGGTKSHANFFRGIIEALSANGHQITFVSNFKNEIEVENVREIVLSKDDTDKSLGNVFESSILEMMKSFLHYAPKMCVSAFTQPEVQNVMKEDYDYIILSLFITDCFLEYVYKKKVPLIYVCPNVIMDPYSGRIGAPEFLSVTPNLMMSFTYPLSFWERVATTFGGFVISDIPTVFLDKSMETLSRERNLWSNETPSIWELQKQASLVIINSVRALEVPIKSTPPTIIYAGGIHIKPTKPLPQDLEDWLSRSGEPGFILFSLGSAVKPNQMKKEHLQVILNVFRSLDQRIIWKWDAQDIEDLPPNVRLSPWLPQSDILAHPKIRLFITHGGLLSTQEATYFEVPIIGMPVFGDQIYNVARIVAEGWGRQITWKELTEEKLRNVITETLTNNSLRQTVAHKSTLMKDWPTKPEEEVVYWTEYVIRHEGAKHLQSPLVHMTWYEIYNLDVWLLVTTVLIIILVVSLLLIKMCCKFCVRKCFKRKTE